MANVTTDVNGTASHASAPASAAMVPAQQGDGRAVSAFSSSSNFESAQRMAKALAASSLVPEAYRGNLPNVLIALDMASRIGTSVMATMQNLDIIHGKPGWRASFLIATVNASGRFTPLRFRWQGKEGSDDWGCRCVAKDRDSGEECVGPLITIATSKAEGWYARNGSKWKTLPELMLTYRAAAFWTRIYAPEISLGMQTSEEVNDTTAVELHAVPAAIGPGDAKALEAELLGKAPTVPTETVVHADEPAKEPAKRGKKAQAEASATVPVPHDPQTGEVIDEDAKRAAAIDAGADYAGGPDDGP